jgi:hypothetical protein
LSELFEERHDSGGVIEVELRRCGTRQKGSKKVVDALGVEKGRELREDLRSRNAKRDNWHFNLLTRAPGECWLRSRQNGKVRAMRSEDEIVRGE